MLGRLRVPLKGALRVPLKGLGTGGGGVGFFCFHRVSVIEGGV